jgi:hypothetical protein
MAKRLGSSYTWEPRRNIGLAEDWRGPSRCIFAVIAFYYIFFVSMPSRKGSMLLRAERARGETGYTYRKMVRLALNGITALSDAPLKRTTLMRFAVVGIAFVVMLYTLYSRFSWHDYKLGCIALLVKVLFLGGVQLIASALLANTWRGCRPMCASDHCILWPILPFPSTGNSPDA